MSGLNPFVRRRVGRSATTLAEAGRRDSGAAPRLRREGASQSRSRLRDHYRSWLGHHRLSAADGLYRILETPLSSVLTWLVLGIALALPVGLDVALDNMARLSAGWQSPTQISLFLREGLSREEAGQLRERLEQWESVASSSFLSREEALEEFREISGFADVLDSLQENPLPDLILVAPRKGLDSAGAVRLRGELELLPEVAQALLDMAWLQRLDSLMLLGRRLVLTLGGLLVVGVVLILGNTLRLAIESRREEIVIIKLVGGSNSFVRRPFLYTGLWYGVGGGVFAAALVAAGLWLLREPVESLALLYESDFQLTGGGVMGALNLVMLGGLLGLAGAWLAVARHLAQIEPQ